MVAQAVVEVYGHLVSEARYKRSLGAIQEQFRVTGHGWHGVVGAIDCTHVKVAKLAGPQGKRWRDRNSLFSVIVQAVVGPDLKFYDVFAGFPGSAHDQHVFAESPLGRAFRAGTHLVQQLLPIPFRQALVKPYLLGDFRYKLLPDLIVPYSSAEEGGDETGRLRFNFMHSSLRMCVERAFGHLKMVFQILTSSANCLKADETRVPIYILSCIIMHNFLKELGHVIDESEAEQFLDPEGAEAAGPGEGLAGARQGAGLAGAGPGVGDARIVRDQLCRLWLTNAEE